MAKKNDMSALVGLSNPKTHYESIDTRKIDNGYVTRHTREKDGKYHTSESFSQNPPAHGDDIDNGRGTNSMRDAVAFLSKER